MAAIAESAEDVVGKVFHYINDTQSLNATVDESMEGLELFNRDGGKVFVAIAATIMLAIVFGHLLHKFSISWLPESLVVVGLGALIGLVLPMGNTAAGHWAIENITISQESIVNEMILNWFLLPIIIFEAGWSLKHRDFISQFPYILLFAIFGTLISMGVVGSLILATGHWHGVQQPRVAFAYAALISAVDPVATLATYAHLNVDPLLNTIVFGESVINDAVAIVLFKTLNEMPAKAYEEMTHSELASSLTSGVIQLLTCSLGLGLALGVLYILILRVTKLGHSMSLSAIFIFFSCFFTYNFAESVLGQSGIIAVLFSGMLLGGYATPHLSAEGTMFTSFLLKQMASIGDMIVFLFVGLAVVFVKNNGIAFGMWVMAFCLLGRAVATVPLGVVTNCIKKSAKHRPREQMHLLSWQHIFMMWHAGLRGGIALVLTLALGDWVDQIDGIGTQEKLRNATLVVICAFLLLFGGTTEIMLKFLGIPMGASTPKMEHHRGQVKSCYGSIRRVAFQVLVGEKVGAAGKGAMVKDVLADAAHCEGHGRDGVPDRDTVRRWAERYKLFGTYDPTHSEEVGRDRTVSDAEDDATPVAHANVESGKIDWSDDDGGSSSSS